MKCVFDNDFLFYDYNIIMRVLVTGGAGFIGSNIVDFLLEKGYEVRVLDNLSTGNKNNLAHIKNNNFEFLYGDISNLEIVRKACDNVYMICHQAAIGSVPRSVDDPLTSHNSNVNGFLNILLVAREKGIKRIVYASSSSVYGDSETLPKQEDNIGNQLSPYAITKYVDELYANLFSKLYGMECIGLRYFNIYGPRQNPHGCYAAVIPKFIELLNNDERPVINGDGQYSRDFTYVLNAVNANYLALTTTDSNCYGNVFNIGANGNITIYEMYDKIRKIMGKEDVEPIFGEKRVGDIPHSHADITKAMTMLKYDPKILFDEGIGLTVKYFLYKN